MNKDKIDPFFFSQEYLVILTLKAPMSSEELSEADELGLSLKNKKPTSRIVVARVNLDQICELSKKDWCLHIQPETQMSVPSDLR
jgi:hypothetical protein